MNPGSPTDKRTNPRYSWGMLELREGGVFPTLHFYDDKSAGGGHGSSSG